jgi:hypothetical protein
MAGVIAQSWNKRKIRIELSAGEIGVQLAAIQTCYVVSTTPCDTYSTNLWHTNHPKRGTATTVGRRQLRPGRRMIADTLCRAILSLNLGGRADRFCGG